MAECTRSSLTDTNAACVRESLSAAMASWTKSNILANSGALHPFQGHLTFGGAMPSCHCNCWSWQAHPETQPEKLITWRRIAFRARAWSQNSGEAAKTESSAANGLDMTNCLAGSSRRGMRNLTASSILRTSLMQVCNVDHLQSAKLEVAVCKLFCIISSDPPHSCPRLQRRSATRSRCVWPWKYCTKRFAQDCQFGQKSMSDSASRMTQSRMCLIPGT